MYFKGILKELSRNSKGILKEKMLGLCTGDLKSCWGFALET